MGKMTYLGVAGIGGALSVIAVMLSLGVHDAQWCQATGALYTNGTIDPDNPWILSDGETTVVCEGGNVYYPWRACTDTKGCEGVVSYCNNVMVVNGKGICTDAGFK